MMLPESGTRKGIGRSRSQRKKGEVLCGRSRSGRPYPLRQAPSPQDFPFPLALYPISCYRSPGPGRGSGGAEAKGKKVRSCAVAHAPAARILYGRLHRPKTSHFPWLYIPWQEGIQREKVWSCPVRQDRAVHRRSEACMAGAQLASLPWLTVDSSKGKR
jgi:hypothetical protein